jgi:hypothetical protein
MLAVMHLIESRTLRKRFTDLETVLKVLYLRSEVVDDHYPKLMGFGSIYFDFIDLISQIFECLTVIALHLQKQDLARV